AAAEADADVAGSAREGDELIDGEPARSRGEHGVEAARDTCHGTLLSEGRRGTRRGRIESSLNSTIQSSASAAKSESEAESGLGAAAQDRQGRGGGRLLVSPPGRADYAGEAGDQRLERRLRHPQRRGGVHVEAPLRK